LPPLGYLKVQHFAYLAKFGTDPSIGKRPPSRPMWWPLGERISRLLASLIRPALETAAA
jgi:hypothetical protein